MHKTIRILAFWAIYSAAAQNFAAAELSIATANTFVAETKSSYPAHIESLRSVDIMSQLDGYIRKVCFSEGALVKKGDCLYLLEDDRYRCRVNQCKAELAAAKAEEKRARRFYESIFKTDTRGTTQLERDTAESQYETAKAMVLQADANLRIAEFDLSKTIISAPITGRIGVSTAAEGSYVSSIREPLTRILQIDPIRAVFSIPQADYLARKRLEALKGKQRQLVRITLADGMQYEHTGIVDFENNSINMESATIFLGASIPNPNQLLLPNLSVTVTLEYPETTMSSK